MAVKFQNYYETLDVARGASAEEIKQAFRKLARIHHPDVAKNKLTGEAKFKEINEAYEVLSDPEKRRRYDALGFDGENGLNGEPVSNHSRAGDMHSADRDFEFGGTGFSDFFESFFGGGGGGGFATRGPAGGPGIGDPDSFAHHGEDIEADLLVTLEEALRGASRKVSLRRPGHNGAAVRSDTYQVRIPAGVREGQRIRLSGQGHLSFGGGAPGDLYLRVRLARHPDFSVKAADLYCDVPLAPWEAVLGVQAKIPTLDGSTSLRIPPGTTARSQLRLKGLGLPRADGTRGDLYATPLIQTPATVSDEERTAWEQLARTSTFRPRTEP